MNWRIIGIIIRREYLNRVKKKAFLFITFLAPIFFILIAATPSIIMLTAKDKIKNIAVIDDSGIITPYLSSNNIVKYIDYKGVDIDSLKKNLKAENLNGILYISKLDTVIKGVSAYTYSTKPLGIDLLGNIKSKINKGIEDYRVANYNIKDLKKIMKSINYNVDLLTYTVNDEGKESISSSEVFSAISFILCMIIYLFITIFAAIVMASVIEEKSNRVVEVLMSSVKAIELMLGKIIGIAMVAITQFILWIILTVIIGTVLIGVVGKDKLQLVTDSNVEMMKAESGGGINSTDKTLNINSLNTHKVFNADSTQVAPKELNKIGIIFNTLREIDYSKMLICFLLYAILGYLLYASIFASIGSAVENNADASSLQTPITIPLLIAFFIGIYASKSPDSMLVFWGSMIPFTSPIVMLTRLPYGVPNWQIIISLIILLVTFFIMTWLSAKIFQMGILVFGKKTTWKDLWKWLMDK